MDRAATDRWDETVKELVQITGDLARLHAAAIGEPAVARQIQIAAMHVARAAGLALPRSRYGRTET